MLAQTYDDLLGNISGESFDAVDMCTLNERVRLMFVGVALIKRKVISFVQTFAEAMEKFRAYVERTDTAAIAYEGNFELFDSKLIEYSTQLRSGLHDDNDFVALLKELDCKETAVMEASVELPIALHQMNAAYEREIKPLDETITNLVEERLRNDTVVTELESLMTSLSTDKDALHQDLSGCTGLSRSPHNNARNSLKVMHSNNSNDSNRVLSPPKPSLAIGSYASSPTAKAGGSSVKSMRSKGSNEFFSDADPIVNASRGTDVLERGNPKHASRGSQDWEARDSYGMRNPDLHQCRANRQEFFRVRALKRNDICQRWQHLKDNLRGNLETLGSALERRTVHAKHYAQALLTVQKYRDSYDTSCLVSGNSLSRQERIRVVARYLIHSSDAQRITREENLLQRDFLTGKQKSVHRVLI